jgi:hypothetical protein
VYCAENGQQCEETQNSTETYRVNYIYIKLLRDNICYVLCIVKKS